MTTAQQWQTVSHFSPSDFRYPDKIDFSIVQALDAFVGLVGKKPVVLSDYRPENPKKLSRHPSGRAVDVAWLGVAPVPLYQQARAFPAFDGVGVYLNEKGAVSFHLDTTGPRSTWGGMITRGVNPDTGVVEPKVDYTTADAVLALLKQKAPGLGLGGVVVLGLLLWLLLRK